MRPLDGITVVALEQAVAAPYATRQLADLGARVIKVERTGGGDFARRYDSRAGGQSSYFAWLNRSKESLVLDLKHPAAGEILERLLADADVFVQNLAPGAAERLGLGADALRERHPRLVRCAISGYGTDGPYATRKAYDLLIQAESGVVSLTGTPETPARVGISVADIAAGMYAYSAILAALFQREREGVGRAIEISMLEALGEWMGAPMYYASGRQGAPKRNGARHATIAPYGPYATRDGHTLLIGIQNEREWRRFCAELLGDAALADDARFATNARRVANREALEAIVARAFAALDTDAAEEKLEAIGIARARLRTIEEFAQHPQLAARDRWREVAVPGGTLPALLPPGLPQGVEPRMDPIPCAGEHTAAILAGLGYASEEITRLAAAGAIEYPDEDEQP